MNELCAQIFAFGCMVTGTLVMFALLVWTSAWAVLESLKYLKVWYVYALAVSIRLHGKKFADSQFWWAIEERAKGSKWAAKNIAKFALEHAPKDEGDE